MSSNTSTSSDTTQTTPLASDSTTSVSTTSTSSSTSTTSTSSTTSTTSTTSTSSDTTSTSTSSSTNTSTTSTTSTTSSPSTTTSSPSTTTQSPVVTTSRNSSGEVVTVTITPTDSSLPSQTVGAGSSGGDKSFFQNTGAVAGTFTAVGIVALALLALIIVFIIRRRRARKWDDEVAEAASEAANSRMPVFLDDPDDRYGGNNDGHGGYGGVAPAAYPSNGAGYAGAPTGYNNVGNYSDASSHGTYAQPVMSHEGPNGQYAPEMSGPAPGGIFDHNAAYAGAGAAGIGVVRARSRGAETSMSANTRNTGPSNSTASGYAAGVGEGESPYPAFLAPGHGYDAYNSALNQSYHNNGLGSDQRGMQSPPVSNSGPEGRTTHANAMASVAAAAAAGGTGSTEQTQTSGGNARSVESYASHYSQGSGSPNASGRPSADHLPTTSTQREELPNPFTSRIESDDESDGEEEVPGRRVLKVANE